MLGRSRGCTTRQFGDGAWRSEARIPPGLPLGATSKPTVSNRVGARKQIEHFFRGQNPTKSQKKPDFQPRGENFTKSQKNPDFQPRGNFIAMNFLAQINVAYPGRRPQAPACFKYAKNGNCKCVWVDIPVLGARLGQAWTVSRRQRIGPAVGNLRNREANHSTSIRRKRSDTYRLSSTACPEIGRKQNLHGADGRHGDDVTSLCVQKLGEILFVLFAHLFVHEIRVGSNSSHFGISEWE